MRGPRLMTAGCRTRRVPWRYGVPILIGWFAGAVALPLADGIGGGLYGNGFLLALIVGQGWPLPLAAMSAYRARRSGACLESPFTWVARQGAILAGLAGGLALARGPLFRGIGRAAWFVTHGEGWAALIVLAAGVEISVAALVLWASVVGIMWADGRRAAGSSNVAGAILLMAGAAGVERLLLPWSTHAVSAIERSHLGWMSLTASNVASLCAAAALFGAAGFAARWRWARNSFTLAALAVGAVLLGVGLLPFYTGVLLPTMWTVTGEVFSVRIDPPWPAIVASLLFLLAVLASGAAVLGAWQGTSTNNGHAS